MNAACMYRSEKTARLSVDHNAFMSLMRPVIAVLPKAYMYFQRLRTVEGKGTSTYIAEQADNKRNGASELPMSC